MTSGIHYTGASIVCGKGASPGRATGNLRYLEISQPEGDRLRPDHICGLGDIQEGDIVVTPDLLPVMCELVDCADGLVIYNEERITGRGSTYARQLEIPAVIDCPDIRSKASTGNILTVDCSAQWVLIHEQETTEMHNCT